MKKLWILVVALALLGGAAFASDVTVSGNYAWYGNTPDFASGSATFLRARLAANAAVDDNNSVMFKLQASGGDFPGNVNVRDFYVKTNVMGALGIDAPVSVTSTVGRFSNYFGGWWFATLSGWEFGDDTFWEPRQDNGAMQLDVGFGPGAVHWWSTFPFDSFAVGADVSLMDMISAWVTYRDVPVADPATGVISLEAKFEKEISVLTLMVPAYFRYNLDASSMEFGGGVNVSYGMFMVAAGLGGTDTNALEKVVLEGKVTPMDGLFFDVAGYLDLSSANAFQGVALEAQKTLGAANLILGFIIGGTDGTAVPVNAWDTEYAKGLYGGLVVDF